MNAKNKKKKLLFPIPEMNNPDINTPERYDLVGEMEAVSATEQTGLVASAPVTQAEYDSYNEILPFEENYLK